MCSRKTVPKKTVYTDVRVLMTGTTKLCKTFLVEVIFEQNTIRRIVLAEAYALKTWVRPHCCAEQRRAQNGFAKYGPPLGLLRLAELV